MGVWGREKKTFCTECPFANRRLIITKPTYFWAGDNWWLKKWITYRNVERKQLWSKSSEPEETVSQTVSWRLVRFCCEFGGIGKELWTISCLLSHTVCNWTFWKKQTPIKAQLWPTEGELYLMKQLQATRKSKSLVESKPRKKWLISLPVYGVWFEWWRIGLKRRLWKSIVPVYCQ